MTQFAGYLRRRPGADPLSKAPFEQCEERLRSALVRAQPASPSEARHGAFWCIAVTVAPWPVQAISARSDGLLGIVAGDPLFTADPRGDAPDVGASYRAVVTALSIGRPDELQAVRGMFAAVVWNDATQTLSLATDKLASRSLYYKVEVDRVVFATSLRLLRLGCSEPERVDEQGFAEFLYFNQSLGPRTVFAGVRVLQPGECVRFSVDSREPQSTIYFDLALVARLDIDRGEALQRLHSMFRVAVRRRLSEGEQEAFLSGGLDSRAIVAELIDQQQQVSTFSASYLDSADDVVAQKMAKVFGSRHQTWLRSPAERIRFALDPFALYAREHFASERGDAVRALWSGDGGSVVLGHVYLDAQRSVLAAEAPTAELMTRLFPALGTRRTRHLSKRYQQQLSEMALQGVLERFRCYEAAPSDRRLFLFYALNDQTRHLYHHFEAIDLSRIELLTPFFDSEFVSLVMSLPNEWFLRHALYNDWIRGFKRGAGEHYWQSYPGHEPCPHPRPHSATDQWNPRWYGGADVQRGYARLADELLRCDDPLASRHISKSLLRTAKWLSRSGSDRLDYEVSNARDIVEALSAAR